MGNLVLRWTLDVSCSTIEETHRIATYDNHSLIVHESSQLHVRRDQEFEETDELVYTALRQKSIPKSPQHWNPS